jgi:hypothetical protein
MGSGFLYARKKKESCLSISYQAVVQEHHSEERKDPIFGCLHHERSRVGKQLSSAWIKRLSDPPASGMLRFPCWGMGILGARERWVWRMSPFLRYRSGSISSFSTIADNMIGMRGTFGHTGAEEVAHHLFDLFEFQSLMNRDPNADSESSKSRLFRPLPQISYRPSRPRHMRLIPV